MDWVDQCETACACARGCVVGSYTIDGEAENPHVILHEPL